jgi:hypothetical protein
MLYHMVGFILPPLSFSGTNLDDFPGMILFPLGQPIFEKLGPSGISMFYVSTIVSQLVFSAGGSIFKGGIGSEMVCCQKS